MADPEEPGYVLRVTELIKALEDHLKWSGNTEVVVEEEVGDGAPAPGQYVAKGYGFTSDPPSSEHHFLLFVQRL